VDHTRIGQLLDGGYIEKYDFDMRNDRLTLQIDVLDHGQLTSFDLQFAKVSLFVFDNESNRKDDRLEFTEIYFEEIPSHSSTEEWKVTISLWDTTHLTIRCSAIELDNEAVS
jgi:hypothetical protein